MEDLPLSLSPFLSLSLLAGTRLIFFEPEGRKLPGALGLGSVLHQEESGALQFPWLCDVGLG